MLEQVLEIGNKRVGGGNPVYVVAEIGFNHNGDIGLAKEMITQAAAAGVDAVKFQTYKASDIVRENAAHYALIKQGELDLKQHEILKECALECGVHFLSTPFSFDAVDLLSELGVPAFKVASMDVTNIPLLKYVAGKGAPVILSTGMALRAEVKQAIEAIESQGNSKIVLLHCMSLYPLEPGQVELATMHELKKQFGYTVGFSDHTLENIASIGAVALGANLIEKHFTIDKSLPGPDNQMSADTLQMRELIADIRKLEAMLVNSELDEQRADRQYSSIFRRGIYSSKAITKGQTLEMNMLKLVRPESVFHPADVDSVVGKRIAQDVATDQELLPDMLEA